MARASNRLLKKSFSSKKPCENPNDFGVHFSKHAFFNNLLKPRRDQEHLASNLDLWPTLAALLKTPPPQGLPGVNLTDARAVARRSRIFGEQYAHNIPDVNIPTQSLEHRWVIDGWWKLIVPNPRKGSDQSLELYNLRDDPWEHNDVVSKETRRVKKLTHHLNEMFVKPPKPREN